NNFIRRRLTAALTPSYPTFTDMKLPPFLKRPQTNATQSTTAFSAQTYQVRVCHTLNGTAGIWATIGSTTTDVTANSSAVLLPAGWPEYFAVTSGRHFNFISTSTSPGTS